MALATVHVWIMSKDNAINTSIGIKTINTTPYQYFPCSQEKFSGNLAENRKLNTGRGHVAAAKHETPLRKTI